MSEAQTLADRTTRIIGELLKRTTDNGFTEAEASAATDKVADILAQHNMTMSDIEARDPGTGEKRQDTSRVGNAMYEHQRNLMQAIVSSHYCIHWVVKMKKMRLGGTKIGMVKSFRVAGRQTNVVAVFNLFDYLNETIEKLCPWRGREQMSRASMSWKAGAAARLSERLYARQAELRRASEAAAKAQKEAQDAALRAAGASAGNALVLSLTDVANSEWDANVDFVYGAGTAARWRAPTRQETPAEKAKREKAQERRRQSHDRQRQAKADRTDWDAYDMGRAAAEKIGLDLQIKQGARPAPAPAGAKRIA